MSILIMQMRRLRHREVEQHARAHTAHKCSWPLPRPAGVGSACCWPWPWEMRSVKMCEVEIEGQKCNIRRESTASGEHIMQLQEQKPWEVPLRKLQNRIAKVDSTVPVLGLVGAGQFCYRFFANVGGRVCLRTVYLATEATCYFRITEMLRTKSEELKSKRDRT